MSQGRLCGLPVYQEAFVCFVSCCKARQSSSSIFIYFHFIFMYLFKQRSQAEIKNLFCKVCLGSRPAAAYKNKVTADIKEQLKTIKTIKCTITM